jgi:hypothetical protein
LTIRVFRLGIAPHGQHEIVGYFPDRRTMHTVILTAFSAQDLDGCEDAFHAVLASLQPIDVR